MGKRWRARRKQGMGHLDSRYMPVLHIWIKLHVHTTIVVLLALNTQKEVKDAGNELNRISCSLFTIRLPSNFVRLDGSDIRKSLPSASLMCSAMRPEGPIDADVGFARCRVADFLHQTDMGQRKFFQASW